MKKFFCFAICLLALQNFIFAGAWSFNTQWLFLKPTFDDSYFASKDSYTVPQINTLAHGKRYHDDCGFRPATRLKVSYSQPETDSYFAAFYTYLYARKNRTLKGSFLLQSDQYGIGLPEYTGDATAKNQIHYNSVDALFMKSLWAPTCFNLNFVFGAELSFVDIYQVSRYVASFATIKLTRKSNFWGMGPEIGFDFEYKLARLDCYFPGQLNFNLVALGSMLASRTSARQSTYVQDGENAFGSKLLDQGTCKIIPAFHARVGLSYDLFFSCMKACLEVGYELSSYIRCVTKPEVSRLGQVDTNYRNFNLQGPFAGINLSF